LAPATLYLVSPAGAKYPLFTWPASAQAPELFAWAGDKTRALVLLPPTAAGRPGGYGELNVLTGKVTPVAFPGAATTALGYTLPDGQQLLGITPDGAGATIGRYSRAGALVQTLVTGPDIGGASYSPDGAILAVPAPGGLQLVSNAGGASTRLAVPGVSTKDYCPPVRWWNATTILASCKSGLWLVPDSGARPTVLVPASDPRRPGYDLGDVDAWQLTSGLYLQSLGACGTVEVNKQAGDGTISRVTIPGMTYSPVVVTASARELLVEQRGCHGSGGELAWFNPASGAEQWIFRTGAGPAAVAYNDPANGERL
jgi:TolB protein